MAGEQPTFGGLLRRYRLKAGFTQEGLADRAGLSLRGVSDLERGLRRLPYPDTIERLIEALGLGLTEREALYAARGPMARSAQLDPAPLPPKSPLPVQLTSFIGREAELSEVEHLLGTGRLVSLTGAGGVGKTRLALEVARLQVPRFGHGVYFVALAGVGTPRLVVAAMAATLNFVLSGPDEPDVQLVRYLRDKHLLLVLDNFEHLLDGARLLTDILSGAPAVSLLVTSRERLNLQEDSVLIVDGLAFPNDQATEPIERYAAVQLFAERARHIQADFSLVEQTEPVIDICRRVEGLPLALELAATWLRVMRCDQIPAQIERSLDFLQTPLRNVPDRHRSMRAVFDRSWSLLSDAERRVLAALSIFRGGFDLDAAERVAGASLAVLASLADKSLVRAMASGRYDLHELVRQYLSEKLVESDDASAVARRHYDFFARIAEQAEAHPYGPDQEAWFDRLEAEYGNLEAALYWSIRERHAEAGLRLAAALGFFWLLRGHFHDGHDWLEKLLAIDRDVPASVRAKALRTAGELAVYLGHGEQGAARCEESLKLARQTGDQWNIAWALACLGFFAGWARAFDQTSPDVGHAAGQLEEALGLFRALGDGWGISHVLRRLGRNATMQGDYDRAEVLLEEALARARDAKNKHAVAWSLYFLGNVVWLRTKDSERALALFQESMTIVSETRDKNNLERLLLGLGQVEQARGSYERAEARYKEIVALVRERGGPYWAAGDLSPVLLGLGRLAVAREQAEQAARLFGAARVDRAPTQLLAAGFSDPDGLERDLATARAQLGEAAFDAAFATGRAMGVEQAVVYALEGRELV